MRELFLILGIMGWLIIGYRWKHDCGQMWDEDYITFPSCLVKGAEGKQ